ncbi:MAG: hypothetical protein K2N56_11445 [Oscillospiraceae bacterium]|nr:hypothetical protein [Oscillospiraceae bacterium]
MDDTKKIIEKYKRELMEMSKAAGGSKQNAQNGSETAKKPQVIGYVSEDNRSYDNFLEDLGKITEVPKPPQKTVESAEDGAQFPDVIFEDTPDDESLDCRGNPVHEPIPEPEVQEPQFVETPGGQTVEIIDESADETVKDGQPLFSAPNYVEIPSTEQVRSDITEQSDPAENRPEQNVSGITDNSAATPRPEQAEVQVTTEEQAERLNDQPVSGTDPDEQLTGRSFEENAPPPASDINMAQGSRAEPSNFPEAVFKSYDDYRKQNPGMGTIVFRVYTGRQAVPLENAECVIYTKINGEKYEIAKLYTNSSGQTPVQELPAPDKELSQHSDNEIQAFALYDAKVTKKGFSQVILEDIPVFDGVQSVQRVFMIVNE